ncbi:type II toxin-antitoxin system RelB/DinJ family antitoxin [Lactobacillus crispatus]|uniref:type II toxin-antitoxin system RelB/DinJ family antitoxin n=1 Tax=Lactobacillus crispatus TaxID=47770 RepID=UPI00254A5C2F|nr:type II toxin-antitoxin system RelB/DinJ family antitoxin [Lactobacillus crispatus]MDK7367012.1 type II toxin-antitoxin system RelB/DinJ family antitoxin [Lactobacillus crispatus]
MASITKKRIQVQIDDGVVEEGNAVLKKLGLTPTIAITMFYKRLIAENGLPFSTNLTEREKDELEIQNLTKNWATEDLDSPEKLQEWMSKDE